MTVNWGDGAVSEEEVATPGAFQFGHGYAAGFYTITVEVQDDAGAVGAAQVQAGVATVQSVDWVALNSPLDGNPGNGRREPQSDSHFPRQDRLQRKRQSQPCSNAGEYNAGNRWGTSLF